MSLGPPQTLLQQLLAICAHLHSFHGFRSLWLTPDGELWHTEPDEECERDNWRYLGTFFEPDPEELASAIGFADAAAAA